MKILLIGEYSRLHNSLKEGLISLGHKVIIAGSGDSFKAYPVDIYLDRKPFSTNHILKKTSKIISKITGWDVASLWIYLQFLRKRKHLVGYDFVQCINEAPFEAQPFFQKKMLSYIFKHNSKCYVSACGDDFIYISFLLSQKYPFSILSPLLKNPKSKLLQKEYQFSLQRINPKFKKLHHFVFKSITGVIPASVEYDIAYKGIHKVLPMIPNPINVDKITYKPLTISDKINIFHGINTSNYNKKGHKYFKEALDHIQKKYASVIQIHSVSNLPYKEYIKIYQNAHILLDQAHAHDQGFNALEAMAMGKVVFTGAGVYFNNYYNQIESVAINAIPDSEHIANELEWLINNPENIIEIGKRARLFIEKHHHYQNIADKYIKAWKNTR